MEDKKLNFLNYSFDKADLLFAVLLVFILFTSNNLISEFKQIPSPPYGGDNYNGLGGVIHILDGGNILDSSQMKGEVPWVPWLYHLCVALFAVITGMSATSALINFSLVIELLSLIVLYLFLQELFHNKYVGLLLFPLFFGSNLFPTFKYSEFSSALIIPIFLYAMLLFLKNPSWKKAVGTGITLGLVGLSNTQAFFVGFLLLPVFQTLWMAPKIINWKEKKLNFTKEVQDIGKLFTIIFVIGFAISLLFWFRPSFVYGGATPNDIQNITTPDIVNNPALLWESITNLFISLLIRYSSGFLLIFSGLGLLGIYNFYRNWQSLESKFVFGILLVWIVFIIHPVFTLPLFNFHLVNFMLVDRLAPIGHLILMCSGLLFVHEKLGDRKIIISVLAIAVLFLGIQQFTTYWENKGTGQWEEYGKTELAEPLADLSTWIRENTDVNDVFLTTNEDGFMMNALSGRKLVSYRRAHASPYIDMHERMADQAVMVYGKNDAERVKLLDKYEVKYLLWTNRWILNEFQFDQNGQLAGFYDPLSVPDESEYENYWNVNGVEFIGVDMSMDPAPRKNVPTYKQLIALPFEFSYEPLNPDIYTHFKLVKTFSYDGQEMFRIYERN